MKKLADEMRLEALKLFKKRGFGHLGGSFSIVDTLAVLYEKVMKYDPENPNLEERDLLVLSKGHAGPALYAVLAIKGFFDKELLMTLNENGTLLPSHPDKNLTPGVDMTTGSLGQGMSVAVGAAKGYKIANKSNRVFTIVGDGELNEGQCWEAIQFANHHKLDNLIIFVDENNKQLDGWTKDICDPLVIKDKLKSFGLYTIEVDGHNHEQILNAINKGFSQKGKAIAIVLKTIKGKGVKEFEEMLANHHIRFSEKDNVVIDENISRYKEALK